MKRLLTISIAGLIAFGNLLLIGNVYVQNVYAAPLFVSSSTAGFSAAATNTTTTLNVTSPNLVLIACRHGTTFVGASSATDTIGNVFKQLAVASDSNDGAMDVWYATSTGTNASDVIRCNLASSVSFRTIMGLTYSGISTSSAIDATTTKSTAVLTNANFTTGALTTTNANDLITNFIQNGGGGNLVPASDYTREINGAAGIATGEADKNVSATVSATTTTWLSASSSWMSITAAFQATPTPAAAATSSALTHIIRGSGRTRTNTGR